MFAITTAGSDKFVTAETLVTAKALARKFSAKYGRTFTIKSFVPVCACGCGSTDPFVCLTVEWLRSLGEWCDEHNLHNDACVLADNERLEVLEALHVGDANLCPTCEAKFDEPCVTKSGKAATKQHVGRK